jgi:Nuclease-related domain
MNIEEARKVLWLKSNHRPLGELIDEGYLNQSRLEWAAEKAYDPTLKVAARIILESLNHSPAITTTETMQKTVGSNAKIIGVDVGISLEQARSTLWPFSSQKNQPMGALVDSKQLSLKDLGFAIEKAFDPRVRQAAIALTLDRLNQVLQEPVPSAGFVNVVTGGRSFAERRETFFTLLQGFFLGTILTSLIAYSIISTINRSNRQPSGKSFTELVSTPTGIIALILIIVFLLFIVWLFNFITDFVTKRIDKQIETYRLGQEGEDRTVQSIVQVLDGNWHLFRNILIPGQNRADLDLVLVGPPGIWALEVKNFHGAYRNIGEKWEYKSGKNWKLASINPSRQANNAAYRLKNFLKADNVNVFVNSAVIWANSESQLTVENPSVAVWRYDRLPDELGNIWQGEKLSEIERNKIVEKLTKLCEQPKKL